MEEEKPSMILVMGATGSGKSYFVNRLVANAVKEGSGLEAG
jgi:predicted GTPase